MKRLFDIIISASSLALLLPVFIVLAVIIKLDSSGTVFFRQKRAGRSGRPFYIYKFRSMVSNADRVGPYSTKKNDPRITRIGRVLRKTSLDELPQLLNVLNGDMSLVGPRPDVFEQRNLYTEKEWNMRLSVRPGITGLAQATLRSSATVQERKALDLEYVQKSGFLYDLRIIIKTFKQVLGKGGY